LGNRVAVPVLRVRLSLPSRSALRAEQEERFAMPSLVNPAATQAGTAAGRTSVLGQVLLAAMLGVVLLFGVGFSHVEAFHNAAHDTRHAAAFPCH
jgi:cobalt transporter subunit CbtB